MNYKKCPQCKDKYSNQGVEFNGTEICPHCSFKINKMAEAYKKDGWSKIPCDWSCEEIEPKTEEDLEYELAERDWQEELQQDLIDQAKDTNYEMMKESDDLLSEEDAYTEYQRTEINSLNAK